MPRVDIRQLPDTSRLFVYNTAKQLNAHERELLRTELDAFLDQWSAHGSSLTVGSEIPYDHFIVIAVDDSRVGPSGCSLDASYEFMKTFTARTGIEILEAPDVCFRDGETLRCVTRAEFKALVAAGAVDAATTVFNNTLATLGDYRAGRWEVPARDSWHARAYQLRESQGA